MASLNLAGTITRVCRDLQQRFAAIVHTHAAADITSGTFDIARVPTGTSSTTAALGNHAHGNITSAGDITTSATIASGDRLVINDESASKVTNSSITFGTSTTTFLANNGTWQTPAGGGGGGSTWANVQYTATGDDFSGYVVSDGHLCVIAVDGTENTYCDDSGTILTDLPISAVPVSALAYSVYNTLHTLTVTTEGELLEESEAYINPAESYNAFTIVYPIANI